jgi:hypothetical protein
VYPIALVMPALTGLVPPLLLALGLAGVVSQGVLLWAAIVAGVNLVWWLLVYWYLGLSQLYALLHRSARRCCCTSRWGRSPAGSG